MNRGAILRSARTPVIVTEVPTGPLVGENPLIVGAAGTVPPHEGNLNDPIRVCQLSPSSVVGWLA